MKKMEITLGSDPELVIVDDRGKPVSALRVLKTTKYKPIDLGDSIRVYADNVLIEAAFDPVPPGSFVARIGNVLHRMQTALGKYSLLPQAATMFPDDELKVALLNWEVRNLSRKQLEQVERSMKFEQLCHPWESGCNPNWDAYVDQPNKSADFTDGMRTGSFHIHVGNAAWMDGKDERLMTRESKIQAIKLLDMFLGIPSIIFDKDPTAGIRRKLYGKAGEFRATPYGIEYRVLGNYALRSKACTELVLDLVLEAMAHISNGTGPEALRRMDEKETVRIINDNDKASALDAVLDLGLPTPIVGRILNNRMAMDNMAMGW